MTARASRRGASPELTVIWWRDVPAQVSARHGRDRVTVELPARFQEAIDAIAMRSGLAGTDAYLQAWDPRRRNCGLDLQHEVDTEVQRLIDRFTDQVLRDLLRPTTAKRPAPRPQGQP